MSKTNAQPDLLDAAVKAHSTIEAFYKWVEMVDEAGGLTSIAGVARAHAMFASLKKNRARIDTLVTDPLLKAIEAAK
jgi:hypothetical protein